MGLESLSRGAKKTVFCDISKKAIEIIQKNIIKTHMSEKSEVILGDFKDVLTKFEEESFDVIFLDSPYASKSDLQAIDIINNKNILTKDGIIIVETDSDEKIEQINELGFNILKIRKYGRVKLVFLNRKG